jgi:hypothetical protein
VATAAAASGSKTPNDRMKSTGREIVLSDCFLGDSMHGYSMWMQGWNTGWMWICGLVLVVVLALILRARK